MFPNPKQLQITTTRQQGFTLLEVLVALAILAIALASVVKVSANQSLNAEHLRDKTMAHWVAMNQLTQLQISRHWPAQGTNTGKSEMGLREWHWQSKITNTRDDRVRQVEISVFRNSDDDASVTRLVSFIGQPF
ncbi:MAG: type II secretion system minor pseudopilin GspI [Gammaproteobacteria bacterium (ex Lamellibrachia satsuma)]|nr:MAG: type II secretion system minor pseudopilin GspI [Gammaproteobacteria bacterium (ex Lamellibrachia satsuma)]